MNLRFCFAFLIIELQAKGSKLSDLHSIVLKVNLPKKAPKSATNFHISMLDFQIYLLRIKIRNLSGIIINISTPFFHEYDSR